MTAPRFFVDAGLDAGTITVLPAQAAHHASHVLRLRDGDDVVLFNGRGGEFHGRLADRGTCVRVERHAAVERESPVSSALVQAWIATDKMEWVVEKAVELGVSRLVLAPARRSVVRLDGARRAKRVERLRDIVIAACCQCGRNRLPTVEAFDDLRSALDSAIGNATGMVLQPDAGDSLAEIAATCSSLAIAVGPEGGFEADEIALAERAGYRPARLGPRVLRTETAGPVAITVVQAIAGDFARESLGRVQR